MYKFHSASIQPHNMKNRDIYWRRYKKHCTQDNDTLGPFKVDTLGPHTVLPVAISCPIIFPWISSTVSNPSLSKVILVWGKSRSHRSQDLGCRGLSHLGDLMFHQNLCMRCDTWIGMLSWWNCQSPVAHSCGLLNHPSSFCGRMFKLHTKFDADSLLYLLSHFECDDHTVHTLTQWRLYPFTD